MHRVILIVLAVLTGLVSPLSARAAERGVVLVNIGWHVGIVLPIDETLRRAMPELAAFPDADHVEIGWGDRDFYQAESPGPLTTLSAALVPTDAVIHLHGFSGPVKDRFSASELLEVPLSDQEFAGLFGHIHASFDRGDGVESKPLGPGLYEGSSWFYKANGEFSLARTCNTWIAEALTAAGLDIEPSGIITASGVMDAAQTALEKRAGAQ
jgi:uncharacterized protein (TIGR02117 family)